MKSLTIAARSAESALRLADALQQFQPELSGADKTGYRITIELLDRAEGQIVAVLEALEAYVTAGSDGPVAVELDGKRYRVHPASGERTAKSLGAELLPGALRAEHRQLVVNVEVGPPLIGRVLVVARPPAALGASGCSAAVSATRPRLPRDGY